MQTKSNVIQYNEYYPFGLQTANSWTRENTTGNNFLYNSATEMNVTSGVYDLAYRNYDPVVGRFNQVDPLADNYGSLTPYNYGNNDPVYWSDPSGAAYEAGISYGIKAEPGWSGSPGRPYKKDDAYNWNPNFYGPVRINGHWALPTQIEWALRQTASAPTSDDMRIITAAIFGRNPSSEGRKLANYNFSSSLTFAELDGNGNAFIPY